MFLTPDVCLQIFFLLLQLSMWVLFSLFFSNPHFYLSDSLFPWLHLPVMVYTYSCCVPYFILGSIVFVHFPSLFLFSSLESHISLSSFSIRNSCSLSHHHRYCTNLLFFFIHFLVKFLYTRSYGWQKYLWFPTFVSSPLAWYFLFDLFTSLAAIDLGC